MKVWEGWLKIHNWNFWSVFLSIMRTVCGTWLFCECDCATFPHCCSCAVCLLTPSLKAASSATPFRAWVGKFLHFLHKCKVKASSIDCFVRQLQEMTASINKACLIGISMNVKPSNIISISSGAVPLHALHISVYLCQVISGDCSGGIQGQET